MNSNHLQIVPTFDLLNIYSDFHQATTKVTLEITPRSQFNEFDSVERERKKEKEVIVYLKSKSVNREDSGCTNCVSVVSELRTFGPGTTSFSGMAGSNFK